MVVNDAALRMAQIVKNLRRNGRFSAVLTWQHFHGYRF
jgi:hypothetical protein